MTGSIFMYVFLDDAVLLLEAVNSAAKMFTLSFLDDEGFLISAATLISLI